MKLIDMTGQKFGRLTVIRRHDSKRWECKCDCGNTTYSDGNQHRKHGYTGTRLYHTFKKMKERCYNPSSDNYKYYGALGITICPEWLEDFSKFADWSIKNGYADNLTIDRKDNTKGYSPDNCRWITIQEQQKNRRKRGTVYGSK